MSDQQSWLTTLGQAFARPDTSQEHIAFRTASPLVNITDEDINRGINVAMAAGPGSVKVIRGVPERIVGATYTTGGKTFTGVHHLEAYENAIKELGQDRVQNNLVDMIAAGNREAADGFLTSTGRVVSREEATKLAQQSGQGTASSTSTGMLKAEDLNLPPMPRSVTAEPDMTEIVKKFGLGGLLTSLQ